MSSPPQSTGPQGRAPLWYCHECHAEMRPLMEPDPHCASCHGTFVEMLGDGGEGDPRSFARENENAERMENIFLGLAGLMASTPAARSPLPGTQLAGAAETGEQRGMRWSTPGGGIRLEVRSGIEAGAGRTRTWAYTTGGGLPESQGNAGAGMRNAANLPTNFPSFPEFVARRAGGDSVPNSPGPQNEIETPFGPMSPEASARLFDTTPGGGGGARGLLMQYLLAMMTGQPALLFVDGDDLSFGPTGDGRGTGAFGDYVFTQDGLDRIVTELMEAAAAQHRPNPAPEDIIEKLQRTKLTYDCDLVKAGQSCAICTEYFAPQDPASASSAAMNEALSEAAQGKAKATEEPNTSSGMVIELPCHHAFHDDCIITWLKTSGTCPVCRYALVEQPTVHAAPGAPGAGVGSPPTPPPLAAGNRASNSTSAPSAPVPAPAPPNPSISTPSTPFTTPPTPSSPTYAPTPSPPSLSRHQRHDSSSTTRSPHAQARQFFQATGGGPLQTLQNIFGGISGARLNGRRRGSRSPVRRNTSEGEGGSGSGFGFGFRRSHDGGSRENGGPQQQSQQQRPNGGASGSGTRRHLQGGHEGLD